jgi:ornithine cyclodeaminase
MVHIDQQEIRFLSQNQVREAGALHMRECIDRMELVFELYNQKKVVMGENGQDLHGHMTTFPSGLSDPERSRLRSGSRFGAMPAYVGGKIDTVGVKWYGSVTPRPEEINSPWSGPLILLSDPDSGRPMAIMDGEIISSMRTGAMAALGAKHIHPDPEVVTILGPGAIGQTSAMAMDTTFSSINKMRIYHPNIQKSKLFRTKMDEKLDVHINEHEDLERAVKDSDIIVAAASRNPCVKIDSSWLTSHSTVIQLGDLQMDLSGYDSDQIICDIRQHPLQFHRQVGWKFTEAFVAKFKNSSNSYISNIRALHEIVGGEDQLPIREKTIFSSLGLPIEDIAWASHVYNNAVASGIGQSIKISDGPYFGKPTLD